MAVQGGKRTEGGPSPSSTKLFARPCVANKSSQHWQLSPGVQPRDSLATLIELAGSNSTAPYSSQSLMGTVPSVETTEADRMCWRVLACLSTEGATVGCGMGCTPLPARNPAGTGYECGDHNCACNGGFAFHNDGTIRSLMDGHCVELVATSPVPSDAADSYDDLQQPETTEMLVQMASCSGGSSQQFSTTAAQGSPGRFVISQASSSSNGHTLCIESDFAQPPPSPHCQSFNNLTSCERAHCAWLNGTCTVLPPPPPPPKPVPQPAVAPEDYDAFFVVVDNLIHDMPTEYHGAIGIFAGAFLSRYSRTTE